MNLKLTQLQKQKNQIGGKGTMRRKVKKHRTLQKHTITFQEKQYNTIIHQINNYYHKITDSSIKTQLTVFLTQQINLLFQKLKRKDYYKKKIIESKNHNEFINQYIISNTNDSLLLNNYKQFTITFSKQGINHFNDSMFEIWDMINEKKYLLMNTNN